MQIEFTDQDRLTTNECKAEFCFSNADITKVLKALGQTDTIVSSRGLNVPALEGSCIFLKYFVPVTKLSKKNALKYKTIWVLKAVYAVLAQQNCLHTQ